MLRGRFSASREPVEVELLFAEKNRHFTAQAECNVLILDDPSRMSEVTTHLLRVGFDDVQGYLEGGIDAWETNGYDLMMLDTISVHDLHRRIGKSPRALTVLDVRTEKEWTAGHIDHATHIHGGKLQERFADVSRERPVAVICGSGYRSAIAASFLKREGYDEVCNVMGGMSAWKAAGFATVTPPAG